MITRMPSTVTKIQTSNATIRNRLVPIHVCETPAKSQTQQRPTLHSPTSMGTLQHLVCGCLGLTFLAGFMAVINLMINMLFQQSASWGLNDLLWMLGH